MGVDLDAISSNIKNGINIEPTAEKEDLSSLWGKGLPKTAERE